MNIFMICCVFIASGADLEKRLDQMENRLERVETKLPQEPADINALDVMNARLNKKLDDESKRMTETWKKQEERVHKHETRLSVLEEYKFWIITIGITLIGGLIRYFRSLDKSVNQRIEKSFKAKKSLITKMIRELETNQIIRQEEQLLVLSKNGSGLRQTLESFGFGCVNVELVQDQLGADQFERFDDLCNDLIIFDDLSSDYINAFIARSERKVFVAYVTSSKNLNITDKEKVNFATAPMTLEPRILEACHYRRALDRN